MTVSPRAIPGGSARRRADDSVLNRVAGALVGPPPRTSGWRQERTQLAKAVVLSEEAESAAATLDLPSEHARSDAYTSK